MFRSPSYSGTTSSFIDTAAPNFAYVTNSFPAGHAGSGVLQAAWSFNASAGGWLRLTTADGPVIPNPTVDFRQGMQFDVLADKPVYIALGLRETSTTAALGANGGNAGQPIEWLGGTTSNTSYAAKGPAGSRRANGRPCASSSPRNRSAPSPATAGSNPPPAKASSRNWPLCPSMPEPAPTTSTSTTSRSSSSLPKRDSAARVVPAHSARATVMKNPVAKSAPEVSPTLNNALAALPHRSLAARHQR